MNVNVKVNKEFKAIVSVSKHTYLLLWAPSIIIILLFTWLAINKHFSDSFLIASLVFILVFFLTLLLIRLKLIINKKTIEYYGFLKKIIIPVHDVSKIKALMIGREHSESGHPKGPGIILIIEPRRESNNKSLCLNIKIFNKSQLRKFIETARKLEIDVYIDDVLSVMLN